MYGHFYTAFATKKNLASCKKNEYNPQTEVLPDHDDHKNMII